MGHDAATYAEFQHMAGIDEAGVHPGLESTQIGDEAFPGYRVQERVEPVVLTHESEAARRGYHDGRFDPHDCLQVAATRPGAVPVVPGHAARPELEPTLPDRGSPRWDAQASSFPSPLRPCFQ